MVLYTERSVVPHDPGFSALEIDNRNDDSLDKMLNRIVAP